MFPLMARVGYRLPRNRDLEVRIVRDLLREEYDKQQTAAYEAGIDPADFSRMVSGQAPLNLSAIGCLSYRFKRKFVERVFAEWFREYVEDKERSA